jgi:glycerol-3-phosphate acyltransferase PlsY
MNPLWEGFKGFQTYATSLLVFSCPQPHASQKMKKGLFALLMNPLWEGFKGFQTYATSLLVFSCPQPHSSELGSVSDMKKPTKNFRGF